MVRAAGLECLRVHPVDTEDGHLLVALARRSDGVGLKPDLHVGLAASG